MLLTIDLQEDFKNDEVVILVDGKEIFHDYSIKTDYAIGLAKRFQLNLPQGSVVLTVDVPNRIISANRQLQIIADIFVGVRVINDEISFRVSKECFQYF